MKSTEHRSITRRFIWHYAKPHAPALVFALILNSMSGFAMTIQTMAPKYLIDDVIMAPALTHSERYIRLAWMALAQEKGDRHLFSLTHGYFASSVAVNKGHFQLEKMPVPYVVRTTTFLQKKGTGIGPVPFFHACPKDERLFLQRKKAATARNIPKPYWLGSGTEGASATLRTTEPAVPPDPHDHV